MAITLKIGSPVENSDFYGRQSELDLAQRRLQGNNLMLAAPRRVGKTSFAKRVLALMNAQGWNGVFINMEGVSDIPAFFKAIYEELLNVSNIGKYQQVFDFIKNHIPDIDVSAKVIGIDARIKLAQQVSDEFSNLQKNLKKIEEPTLIVLDELTVFLEKLLGLHGEEVVREFLNQFRALRQESGTQCHWMVASSIGVRNFTSGHRMSDTLNDFADFPLGAYQHDEAVGLVRELATSEDIKTSAANTQYLLEKIGWNIPFFIQLLISYLPNKHVKAVDIDAAYESLLHTSAFETWSERLSTEYKDYELVARQILNYLCLEPNGKERNEIYNRISETGITEEQFSTLLMALENDGYLGKTGARRYYRSPLLRDYWKRKFCE